MPTFPKQLTKLSFYKVVLVIISIAFLVGSAVCMLCESINSERLYWSLIVSFSALILTLYLWCTYAAFATFRDRCFLAIAACAICAIAAVLLINLVLSWLISEPILDLWDFLAIAVLVVIGVTCLIADQILLAKQNPKAKPAKKAKRSKKNQNQNPNQASR